MEDQIAEIASLVQEVGQTQDALLRGHRAIAFRSCLRRSLSKLLGTFFVEGGQEVATLPPSALLQSGGQPQVWVVGQDDKVQRREVKLVEFDAGSIVVSHGLSAGDKVVTAGVNSLADGDLVNPETEIK